MHDDNGASPDPDVLVIADHDPHDRRAPRPDVVVIGGGAIGLAVAWRAAQAGLEVTVLERGRPGGETSFVAAGMLAPISEATPTERGLLALGLRSAAHYQAFVAELADASGRDPGYLPCGTLAVARDGDEAQALEREFEMRRGLGLEVERLRPSAARRLEPALAPTLRLALEVPGDHAIDPRTLTAALAEAATRAGATIRSGTEVAEIVGDGDVVTGVLLAGGERVLAEHVVVAAGPWSAQLAGVPGAARVPVRPVKGQILRLHDPAGPGLVGHVLRLGGGYVVPRGDGRYVLGATTEERGFDRSVTAGAAFELLREAIELVPGFSELELDECSAGLRPATPDGVPAIGPGAVPGLHWATGHHRGGILLAPLTAELVLAGLTGAPACAEAASVAPTRFAAVEAHSR
ncbi:MAG TPA: glycine oxidase ThiO [Solirubrobacteraceae bacterium]|jgi:glycine oxidase|nr:glycine oxidase ThiO [Solirubrobacteraceae bacterium]